MNSKMNSTTETSAKKWQSTPTFTAPTDEQLAAAEVRWRQSYLDQVRQEGGPSGAKLFSKEANSAAYEDCLKNLNPVAVAEKRKLYSGKNSEICGISPLNQDQTALLFTQGKSDDDEDKKLKNNKIYFG